MTDICNLYDVVSNLIVHDLTDKIVIICWKKCNENSIFGIYKKEVVRWNQKIKKLGNKLEVAVQILPPPYIERQPPPRFSF